MMTSPDIILPLARVIQISFMISIEENRITPSVADKNTNTLVIMDFAEEFVAMVIASFLLFPNFSSS